MKFTRICQTGDSHRTKKFPHLLQSYASSFPFAFAIASYSDSASMYVSANWANFLAF